jgi:hypothetical protein
MSFRPSEAGRHGEWDLRIARGGVGVVLAGALAVGITVATPTSATAATGAAAGAVRWTAELAAGDAVGVQVADGAVRLAPERITPAAVDPDGHGDTRPDGLLTLPVRRLDAPADRVEATLDADGAAGVDVRGLRPSGTWTEWLPAEPTGGAVGVVLPAPVVAVQARLVLDPDPTAGAPNPEVRALNLAAFPAPPSSRAQAPGDPQHHRVFATREGLVGRTTANGHVIDENDLFVALPSRRALSPKNTSDYSVKLCAPTGRCAFAPVWDVGPWNTRDDYWNPPDRREFWKDLPQGLPQAQAAKEKGYNGGKDQFGRVVKNPAGIDLADGLFRDALGLRDNAWLEVDYLWTGDSPLATVRVDGRVDLRGAPRPGAAIVGLVADRAAVPLQCVSGDWLRIGVGQFLPVTAVPRAQWPGPLPKCAGS